MPVAAMDSARHSNRTLHVISNAHLVLVKAWQFVEWQRLGASRFSFSFCCKDGSALLRPPSVRSVSPFRVCFQIRPVSLEVLMTGHSAEHPSRSHFTCRVRPSIATTLACHPRFMMRVAAVLFWSKRSIEDQETSSPF